LSIIYDALKKVELAQKETNEEPPKKEKFFKLKNTKLYLIYLLVICLGIFAGNIFFGYLNSEKKPALAKQEIFHKSKKPQQAQVPRITQVLPSVDKVKINDTKKESPASLVLNGVFSAKNQSYALVNNQIVKEGDIIEGATVKRIEPRGVELEKSGQVIKLSIKAD
jgi:type II secretory pathway component PulC